MKHMKKSMFITTLAMVVVLVVALSTATFAWYTANTQVSVNSTVVTSAASSAASLAIDKTNSVASTNSEVTITMNSNLMPMIPSAKPTSSGTPTTYGAFTGNDPYYFFQAPVNNAGAFTSNGSGTIPATIATVKNATGDASNLTGFYVINTDATNQTSVNAAITISTTAYTLLKAKPSGWDSDNTSYFKVVDGAYVACTGSDAWAENSFYKANDTSVYKDLRVAMFVDGNYVNTWSYEGSVCYYGTIAKDANSTSSLSSDYTTLASTNSQTIGSINAVSSKLIQLVAWFDGVGLAVDEASSAVFFTVSFTVAA